MFTPLIVGIYINCPYLRSLLFLSGLGNPFKKKKHRLAAGKLFLPVQSPDPVSLNSFSNEFSPIPARLGFCCRTIQRIPSKSVPHCGREGSVKFTHFKKILRVLILR